MVTPEYIIDLPSPEIVRSADVPHRLVNLLNNAHQYAYIKTLQFAPTNELAEALEFAAFRGVKVAVFADNPHRSKTDLLDSMSAFYENIPPYVIPTYRWANPLINWVKDLKIKGIPLGEIGLREHDKAIAIDGRGLVGGVNINPYDFGRKDFLIDYPEPHPVAKALKQYLVSQVENKPLHSTKIDSKSDLMVEMHRPFRWDIYTKACRWVVQAQDQINLTTPFVPIGRLLHLLLLKSKEIPVKVNLSSVDDVWTKQTPYKELFDLSIKQMELSIYHGHRLEIDHASEPIHAKVLQVGSQIMFGSHNFWEPGIFGLNREMDIATTDPQIVELVSQAVTV